MSDTSNVKTGLVSRMGRWLRDAIIQEVPRDTEACEFDCKARDCTRGEWETCENRLRVARSGKP